MQKCELYEILNRSNEQKDNENTNEDKIIFNEFFNIEVIFNQIISIQNNLIYLQLWLNIKMYNNNSEGSTIECEQYVAIQKWNRGLLNK